MCINIYIYIIMYRIFYYYQLNVPTHFPLKILQRSLYPAGSSCHVPRHRDFGFCSTLRAARPKQIQMS